jgi:hypothetical protein
MGRMKDVFIEMQNRDMKAISLSEYIAYKENEKKEQLEQEQLIKNEPEVINLKKPKK